MTTQSPAPFPSNGQRPLSTREALQRSQAMACTAATARPTCQGQVFVGIFFDGTGNNLEADYTRPSPDQRKHSNVVRLFHTHRHAPPEGYFSHYIPGVGTPFPEIDDKGGTLGKAMASRGEERIHWAYTRLLNSPHVFVREAPLLDDARAKTIAGNTASTSTPPALRRTIWRHWQDQLQAALKDQKPTVVQLNVSVFGFSRGAAQARAFVNWLFEVCDQRDGAWRFAGIPLRLQFLGLFDTVASVGLADLLNTGMVTGHQSWADDNLQIHPAVEQCVHFMAGHEVRACFPADSVRVGAQYPANVKEVMYPGAHSDVGGGYAPHALGVGPGVSDCLAVVPGKNMYDEARLAGVPLLSFARLREAFRDALTPSASAISAFNNYVKHSNAGAAPAAALHRRHWAHYIAWRLKRRADWNAKAPVTRANAEGRNALTKTQTDLIKRLARLAMGNPAEPAFDLQQAIQLHRNMNRAAGLQPSAAERSLYDLVDALRAVKLTPEIEHLFEHYVHDSMAGFAVDGVDEFKYNGLGIAKFRLIFAGND
jgi:hypothetical protein